MGDSPFTDPSTHPAVDRMAEVEGAIRGARSELMAVIQRLRETALTMQANRETASGAKVSALCRAMTRLTSAVDELINAGF
jgi:hypothetical protein